MLPQTLPFFFLFSLAGPALALSYCASDGRPAPLVLVERFISADCGTCWTEPQAAAVPRGAMTLDWIVPGTGGEQAPLSAAAMRDAQARLQALQRAAPLGAETVSTAVARKGRRPLRVAHGLPFAGYLGASIEMKPAPPLAGDWAAYLVMVETIAAGSEETPIERHLVRNVLQLTWHGQPAPTPGSAGRFFESRPMGIPEGAHPERLAVIGWVQDDKGRVVAAAQSHCAADFGR